MKNIDYVPKLDSYQLQKAISFVKIAFEKRLSQALNLKRVSAPLFVSASSGINDNLSGTERPVSFDIPAVGYNAEVVHSLAKWKRLALKKYNFKMHEGIYTDMNAIRRDEALDEIHSIYVDQWDWEKIIDRNDRTISYLKETVSSIVNAICDVSEEVCRQFPSISLKLKRDVSFITTQELEDMFPSLSPEERENKYLEKNQTAFIMQIGDKLRSGAPHGCRAPDYDDWALNGDIIFYDEVLGRALEVSSMGIRVDEKSLLEQLKKSGCEERKSLPFHKMLLKGELPLTMGGGIGQSRICMLLLQCAHIGEVQCSLWDEKTLKECKEKNIHIL